MAEGALFNVAEGIIGQLGNLVLKELGLLWGVKEELQKLEDTVSTIKAVILDAEEKQAQNHTIKNWLGRLKDALFEADDLLDDFSTEVLRREVMTRNKKAKEVRIFFSKSNQLAYGLKMGHKIQALRERLDAIAEDRKKFHLDERPRETQVTNPIRETDYFVRAETVIGREFDKKVILERLLDSNIEENVSVYSIVGIGGLGKTTLAQLVFNDEEIEKEFERKFWVCVSDDFDVNIIVKKILEYAKRKKLENLERNASITDLQKEIDGKRFLLVLDDVWNDDSEKWDKLKEILLAGARGSRILVTTREEKVAESSKTIETHRLTGLNDEDSWSLFKQKAFKKGQEPKNSKYKEIGMEIVSKCKGVPLAIKTIGSLLYSKKSEEEWLSFKNNEFSKVNETNIQPILRLSYDHLPPRLKQCFAYCSLFPKDYEIEEERLVKLWMAQGFIKPLGQNQCLEDVGHEYFMELLWRSFFQKDKENFWDEGPVFKIHDLMHDLAILVAGLESTTFEINGKNIDEKTHHMSFGFNLGSSTQISTLLFKANRMRTFLLPCQIQYSNQMVWNQLTCDAFVSSFKFLRLLDLHETGIRNVPHSIGKLKHLRYLDLSYNERIKILPNSITRLQNLETLDLSYCKELIELPKNISKLVNLRHLNIDECDSLTHMPRGFGQLTNLHSLAQYVLSTDSRCGGELKELHGLNQLRENLTIKNLRHKKDAELEYKAVNLKEKQHLKGLTLEWIEREVDAEYDEMSVEALEPNQNLKSLRLRGYGGVKYPSWLSLLKNLVRLVLVSMKNCQDVLPLHQFPSLKNLWLFSVPSLKYVSLVSESFKLPPLQYLYIEDCPNLKGWWKRRSDSSEEDEDAADHYGEISTITTKNHSFSLLSDLDISGCPKLSSMPLFPYLERLSLDNSNLRLLERTISMGMISTVSQENPTAAAVAESTSSAPSSSSTLAASFTPLSKLKYLGIGMIEGSNDHFLQHFTALEDLSLYNYNGVEMELEWQGLRKLQDLTLYNHPKLASLPVGLQQATSLRYLEIRNCLSLTTLPEWICEIISLQSLNIAHCPNFTSLPVLTSLKTLNIWNCPNLTSLPALTSLKTLDIWRCPILVESCKIQDWLARIENLEGDLATAKEEDPEQTWGFTKIFGRCSGSTSQYLSDKDQHLMIMR
ncbi:putative disease resistance protein RGA1 isoform X1 [Quercus lobata]|uniref:putative disease resistance protein RGA1 isoform X1 n=1 Tax=Quercus lobata TaxID=97700 RepID=UPI0012451F02|nr:putative disease resistance protein RGA1 isoform X1 [Quercus lobata]XP_030965132.1 putative disease resistance protein RGA1 isoform X1 [Quercus lobata]XP_030965133.1 putative disease resistance protein RGA1 isoform X1 [Quercus lobata]XP_030965135.1 putative disease resistance protein RGA1 isoform X1 [Quercus lobata]XP_030965136.1 putative disease resistance protein RGA1 isoform X1 [Quercus lobata]XP_030965137.1 putative disease resistance protein RGA1 isoform X1 [Quercus lobata]XP_03096513